MSSENKRQGQEKPLGQLVKGIMKAYGLEDKLKILRPHSRLARAHGASRRPAHYRHPH